ncbi:MAG: DUF2905 domain-containing protein [Flavobacteriaceae bacterium]|jgi:hypothetical protein|nr:DUF2905 domain-containing protein [Flavobacteriaceae bacterium]NVJ73418.1 DUF2905 domain-containing protein [Flavobacteriaceae bacterium]
MAKSLITVGLILVLIGALLWLFDKSSLSYNNPLDFSFKKGNTQIYFPLGSSLILSILLSVIFYWFKGK